MTYCKTIKRADGQFDVVSNKTGNVLMPRLTKREDANAWRDHFNAEHARLSAPKKPVAS